MNSACKQSQESLSDLTFAKEHIAMNDHISPSQDSISRRSFFGVATVAIGASSLIPSQAFAQSESGSSQPSAASSASDSQASHITSLIGRKPNFANQSGNLTRVDADAMHRMKGLSIRRLQLSPRGIREPHWHANAHELGYCLRGKHLATVAGDHSTRHSFTISPGEMFFVPSGAFHSIENIGSEEGEIILGFSHERPEDFGLSGVLGSYTDAVLGNTFGLPASAFANIKRTSKDTYIGMRTTSAAPLELEQRETSPYKFTVEKNLPAISSTAGIAHLAQSNAWPILENISMFSVDLTHQGMRELHWHPETSEMGYITNGRGRMTIVSPGGSLDTFEMHPGDVYFIPAAYPHHFEDLGEDDLKLLVFFDRARPGDIGMRAAGSCFSKDVLAASFGISPSQFPDLPFVSQDPLIVPRMNPIDPAGRS
jgi:oxalate decarboxylase